MKLIIVLAIALSLAQLAKAASLGHPGDPKNGKKVFVQFCGRCHIMKVAGTRGTIGPNLDTDRVSFAKVVSSIEEGVGGIQAEYLLRAVTFSQVYDVAKFVVLSRRG